MDLPFPSHYTAQTTCWSRLFSSPRSSSDHSGARKPINRSALQTERAALALRRRFKEG